MNMGSTATLSSSGSSAVDMVASCSACASKPAARAVNFADRASIWASL